MARQPYDVNRRTRHLDVHKQFSGGLKTVDTDDALRAVFLRQGENISLSEFGFLEKRHGTAVEDVFEFKNKEGTKIPTPTGLVQGYFEFVDEDEYTHKIIIIDGVPYIKYPHGDHSDYFVKQEIFYTEEGYDYPDRVLEDEKEFEKDAIHTVVFKYDSPEGVKEHVYSDEVPHRSFITNPHSQQEFMNFSLSTNFSTNQGNLPPEPYKEGYKFIGWDYDFDQPIEKDTIIQPIFVVVIYKKGKSTNNSIPINISGSRSFASGEATSQSSTANIIPISIGGSRKYVVFDGAQTSSTDNNIPVNISGSRSYVIFDIAQTSSTDNNIPVNISGSRSYVSLNYEEGQSTNNTIPVNISGSRNYTVLGKRFQNSTDNKMPLNISGSRKYMSVHYEEGQSTNNEMPLNISGSRSHTVLGQRFQNSTDNKMPLNISGSRTFVSLNEGQGVSINTIPVSISGSRSVELFIDMLAPTINSADYEVVDGGGFGSVVNVNVNVTNNMDYEATIQVSTTSAGTNTSSTVGANQSKTISFTIGGSTPPSKIYARAYIENAGTSDNVSKNL